MNRGTLVLACAVALALTGCDNSERPSDEREQQVGYRSGTEDDGYLANGERGNILISEINWAGSVKAVGDGRVYDPDDVFIELQNKHPRPIQLTNWQLQVYSGTNRPGKNASYSRPDRPRKTWVMPRRENGKPIAPNDYVLIAKKRDGAFRNADYYIEDLEIPKEFFEIVIRDLDDRLIEPAGSNDHDVFAGSWDHVTVRSMERIQLIFANRGSRESAWHTYSLNPWDAEHEGFRVNIHEDYRKFTFASPGMANSPDYSGNTAAGDFQ